MNDPVEKSFEQTEQIWAPVIGSFILEFATIEDYLHSVISWYLSDKFLTEADLRESLTSRLSLFKKIMHSLIDMQHNRFQLENSVEGIRKLISIRNLLAHNSLSLEMEQTSEGSIREIGPIISGRRDPDSSITLDALKLKLFDIKRYRNDLEDLLVIFHKHTYK